MTDMITMITCPRCSRGLAQADRDAAHSSRGCTLADPIGSPSLRVHANYYSTGLGRADQEAAGFGASPMMPRNPSTQAGIELLLFQVIDLGDRAGNRHAASFGPVVCGEASDDRPADGGRQSNFRRGVPEGLTWVARG